MHPQETVEEALVLAAAGLPTTRIAKRLGIPRSTVRDWIGGLIPRVGPDGLPGRCAGFAFRPKELPRSYIYLLGLYLGDGCLSPAPRDVSRSASFSWWAGRSVSSTTSPSCCFVDSSTPTDAGSRTRAGAIGAPLGTRSQIAP